MKVVFISNYLNHHQLPLSIELFERLGENYCFVSTEAIRTERLNLGYEDMNKKYPFVIKTYDSSENRKKAKRMINDADVVIIGSAPYGLVRKRVLGGKLTFRYLERPLKKGNELFKYIPRLIKWHLLTPQGKAGYLLCASAYAAADFMKFGMYKNRTYRWGYFPEVKEYEDIDALIENKGKASIMWAGRMIDWKHPEYVIMLAKRLKEDGYDFNINMLGNGALKEEIEKEISDAGLSGYVHLLGGKSPDEVREYMEKVQIYLFTSNFQEGWGAVLNEAMNSGCAVVASHAIGSVPFLMKNEENGLIFRNEDSDDLYIKVKYLLDNQNEAARLGKNAYQTMKNEWNARVLAERFIQLSESLLLKNEVRFDEGPLSRAEIIENDWM